MGLVLLGGVKRIGSVAEKLVPFMAVFYIILALGVVILNIGRVQCSHIEIRSLSQTCISEIEVFQPAQRIVNKLNCVRQLNSKKIKLVDFCDRCLFKGFILIEKVKRKIEFLINKM